MRTRKKKLAGERTTVRVPEHVAEAIARLIERTGWTQPDAVDFALQVGMDRIDATDHWPALANLLNATVATHALRSSKLRAAAAKIDRELRRPEPGKRGPGRPRKSPELTPEQPIDKPPTGD